MIIYNQGLRYKKVLISILFLALSSCNSNETPSCLEIEVIGRQNCTNNLLGRVRNNKTIGNDIKYFDGKNYKNVVELISDESFPDDPVLFVSFRAYDQENDSIMFFKNSSICTPLLGSVDVPTYVVTDFNTKCLD